MRQRHCSLKWRKESQPKPVGIERSSPDGHRPQRLRAIFPLHVHLRLGLQKQLDHLRVAFDCRCVQRGPASVQSPPCGRMAAVRMHHIKCASGHLPLQSSAPSCWSRCLCYKAFFIRCMFDYFDWSDRDWPKSTPPIILYQVHHRHANITNRIR